MFIYITEHVLINAMLDIIQKQTYKAKNTVKFAKQDVHPVQIINRAMIALKVTHMTPEPKLANAQLQADHSFLPWMP